MCSAESCWIHNLTSVTTNSLRFTDPNSRLTRNRQCTHRETVNRVKFRLSTSAKPCSQQLRIEVAENPTFLALRDLLPDSRLSRRFPQIGGFYGGWN